MAGTDSRCMLLLAMATVQVLTVTVVNCLTTWHESLTRKKASTAATLQTTEPHFCHLTLYYVCIVDWTRQIEGAHYAHYFPIYVSHQAVSLSCSVMTVFKCNFLAYYCDCTVEKKKKTQWCFRGAVQRLRQNNQINEKYSHRLRQSEKLLGSLEINRKNEVIYKKRTCHFLFAERTSPPPLHSALGSMSYLGMACKLTSRASGCVRSFHQTEREEGCPVHLPWANSSFHSSLSWAHPVGRCHRLHVDGSQGSAACFDWIVKQKWEKHDFFFIILLLGCKL